MARDKQGRVSGPDSASETISEHRSQTWYEHHELQQGAFCKCRHDVYYNTFSCTRLTPSHTRHKHHEHFTNTALPFYKKIGYTNAGGVLKLLLTKNQVTKHNMDNITRHYFHYMTSPIISRLLFVPLEQGGAKSSQQHWEYIL